MERIRCILDVAYGIAGPVAGYSDRRSSLVMPLYICLVRPVRFAGGVR